MEFGENKMIQHGGEFIAAADLSRKFENVHVIRQLGGVTWRPLFGSLAPRCSALLNPVPKTLESIV
jgi:hypothetical protein